MMFPDLTTVNVPFGLLDRETQDALEGHGGPWEFYNLGGDWETLISPAWSVTTVYRVKPAPPKPREWWLLIRGNGEIKAYTGRITACGCHDQIIHVREVLPE